MTGFAKRRGLATSVALLLTACGGAAPPSTPAASADTPFRGSSATPSEPTAGEDDESGDESGGEGAAEAPSDTEPDETSEPTAPSEQAPSSMGPSRTPSEIIGAASVAFIIDYNASAPKQAAESSCSAESGDDPAKRAECMQKARASFSADVLRFKRDQQGRWWWTIYQRIGASLPEVYKAQVEFAGETQGKLNLRIKGSESGRRPIFTGTKQIAVSVPNDYTLVLDDPKFGRLQYDAKVGLVGN